MTAEDETIAKVDVELLRAGAQACDEAGQLTPEVADELRGSASSSRVGDLSFCD